MGRVWALNGRYCWARGFWLAWAGRGSRDGRVSFDMMAGLYMAPCVWPRASGRHGLGTGGLWSEGFAHVGSRIAGFAG